MNTGPRILLTGATGTVGFEVLKQLYLVKDRFEITLFVLPEKRTRMLAPYLDGVTVVYGDIAREEDVIKVCMNKDFVIHLAAVIPPKADIFPDLAFEVNTRGTRNLLENLEKFSPGAFFIYSSSISVYGDRLADPYIKVGDPLKASMGDEYARTKIAAEHLIQQSKLEWTIFRLTAIMGNHSDKKLMFHMPLDTSMEIATPADTGRAFVNALERRSELSQGIFNLSGGAGCRISFHDFLSRSFALFGLGEVNFPEKSFAEKNFHCGFYSDGDILEAILKFRQDDMDDYFRMEKAKIPQSRKILTSIFKKQIKKSILRLSEPYIAYHSGNTALKERYF